MVGNNSTFKNLNAITGRTEATVVKRITSQMNFWVKECRAFPVTKEKLSYVIINSIELIDLMKPSNILK